MTPVLRDRLYWLRAPQRIQFKVALLVYQDHQHLLTTSPSTVDPAAQTTVDPHFGLQTKRSSWSRELELNSERSRSHMQDHINGINYHYVSDNHHLSKFLKPDLKQFSFLSLTVTN